MYTVITISTKLKIALFSQATPPTTNQFHYHSVCLMDSVSVIFSLLSRTRVERKLIFTASVRHAESKIFFSPFRKRTLCGASIKKTFVAIYESFTENEV